MITLNQLDEPDEDAGAIHTYRGRPEEDQRKTRIRARRTSRAVTGPDIPIERPPSTRVRTTHGMGPHSRLGPAPTACHRSSSGSSVKTAGLAIESLTLARWLTRGARLDVVAAQTCLEHRTPSWRTSSYLIRFVTYRIIQVRYWYPLMHRGRASLVREGHEKRTSTGI
jgi:hypothetical protein